MSSYDNRFGGTRRLYGSDAVERFRSSHVCVVGIGGVGSWVAEALARSGVGEITLIDQDDICETNINRQIHALDGAVGKSKIAQMAERIRLINPECLVHEESAFINKENTADLIGDYFDYVVDAIDSVKDKAALIAYCRRNKVPVICVGGAGGQLDPTCVSVCDLSKTHNDPLAAKVRSFLRRHYNYSKSGKKFGVECVFSTEQLRYPQADGSVCNQKNLDEGLTRLDCDGGFGAAVVVTSTFGMVAASRVLNKLMLKADIEAGATR
ncbi:tRNA cyclic N6-threonylcarbamoyladenosine(37) synthase TcdA [Neptunomonas phycophila]|uniref:tRNA cyclic N6-threonylcarbamoyladenosine(37) synthase TcdA n=1 Tax=Neptunomonas phycophila TaxID=1572645 RepID=UPI000948FE27|nr:tRNA cyclic N6-threonylcarbamoyladenosine(37) synthase TcdA [Neptunomonas phycophila]MBT3147326.1 tRNA cyclic N6-threonylcarbamoyladenosine(37) synthase TcdA [Neptunomonas phycophila]MDO6785261.1 tRNA cyclic N6-threonylcarbamoyladenosine(37) synthase TcdA [Neptunomonas phycophila]